MAIKIIIKDSQKLAEIIYRNGDSVCSFAKKIDISNTTLQLLIDNKRDSCSPKTAIKIAEKLKETGVTYDDIFFVRNTYKSKNYDFEVKGTE